MEFKAIVLRRLRFICGPVDKEIIVGVSAPYTPPLDKAMADKGYSACGVLTCDDPTLAYEVFGCDEFEALEMAVIRVNQYLTRLSEDPNGELQFSDGHKFEPGGSEFMKGYLNRIK